MFTNTKMARYGIEITAITFWVVLVAHCQNGFSEGGRDTRIISQEGTHETSTTQTSPEIKQEERVVPPEQVVTDQTSPAPIKPEQRPLEKLDTPEYYMNEIKKITGIQFPVSLFPSPYTFDLRERNSDICLYIQSPRSSNTVLFAVTESEKITEVEFLCEKFDFSTWHIYPTNVPQRPNMTSTLLYEPFRLETEGLIEAIPLRLKNNQVIDAERLKLALYIVRSKFSTGRTKNIFGIQCTLEVKNRHCYFLIYSDSTAQPDKYFLIKLLNSLLACNP